METQKLKKKKNYKFSLYLGFVIIKGATDVSLRAAKGV